jgi:hypothetical protein
MLLLRFQQHKDKKKAEEEAGQKGNEKWSSN